MKKYGLFLVPLVIVAGLNIYFRSFPINFPQLKRQARDMVNQAMRGGVAQQVARKFPQYDPLVKERLLNVQAAEYQKNNAASLKQQVENLYQKLKDRFQDESGQTYLMELDCWHWSRYVKNVADFGHPGDEVRDGRQFDTRMLSPFGDYLAWNQFNFYFPAFLYKIFSWFKHIPIFTFIFYLPLFFALIFIVLLYLFVYQEGGVPGAIIASLFIGLSPVFIPRSCAGWFDMDTLNLIFPMAIVWTYLIASQSAAFKKKILWLCVSAFLVGLFCFTWGNWWFVFFIIIIYEVFSIAAEVMLCLRRPERGSVGLKQHSISVLIFSCVSLIGVVIFSRAEALVVWWQQIRDAIVLNKPLLSSIWPNVFSTVGELRKLNPSEVTTAAGGIFLAILSALSLMVLFVRAIAGRAVQGFKREAVFIMVLWLLSMLYASFRGVRFTMFLIIPLGVSLGWGIEDFLEYLRTRLRRWQSLAITCIIVVGLSAILINRAYKIACSIYPLMHDGWYKVLTLLKETTPPDTTIDSWWDFGDWFKVVAERKVIFDGQSQNKPQAFWMAKALLATDEGQAFGILRMLNNGGNKAFEVIDGYLNDPLQSMLLLESIIPLDPGKAKAILGDFLPNTAVDQVILLLFDKPDNAVFVVDYSMIYKIGAISYLGNWNFAKVYMVQNFNRTERDRILAHLAKLGKDKSEMQKFYQEVFLIPPQELETWISRPVQFYSSPIRGHKQGDDIIFDNGFIYNQKEKLISANNGQVPLSLFIPADNDIVEIRYKNPQLPFSVLVFENKDGYWAVLLDPALARSLFVRLYFLNGFGLTHFKAHIDVQEGGNFIGSYKINW